MRSALELRHTAEAAGANLRLDSWAAAKRRPPNKEFFTVAMLYLIAEGFGRAGLCHGETLNATLPPEKLLKNMGICVSRVTAAKRYIKNALGYLNSFKQKRKRDDETEECETY